MPDGVRLVGRRGEDVEGEPLRGPGADPGKARELRDEVVDRGAQHGSSVPSVPAREPTRQPRAASVPLRVTRSSDPLDRPNEGNVVDQPETAWN